MLCFYGVLTLISFQYSCLYNHITLICSLLLSAARIFSDYGGWASLSALGTTCWLKVMVIYGCMLFIFVAIRWLKNHLFHWIIQIRLVFISSSSGNYWTCINHWVIVMILDVSTSDQLVMLNTIAAAIRIFLCTNNWTCISYNLNSLSDCGRLAILERGFLVRHLCELLLHSKWNFIRIYIMMFDTLILGTSLR